MPLNFFSGSQFSAHRRSGEKTPRQNPRKQTIQSPPLFEAAANKWTNCLRDVRFQVRLQCGRQNNP